MALCVRDFGGEGRVSVGKSVECLDHVRNDGWVCSLDLDVWVMDINVDGLRLSWGGFMILDPISQGP